MTTIVTIDMGGTGATSASEARSALGVSSAGDSSNAYAQANAAYNQANTARSDANTTFATVNTTFGTVNTSLATINTNYQAAYAQANTARDTGNNAYGSANLAYAQANTARSDANSTFATINTTFSTLNTSFSSTNTNYQAAYAQANTARDTANNAYNNSNTKLSTSGGSISGDLSITGNLVVQGNATTINVSNLSVNDSIILLATGGTGDSTDIGFVGHFQRGATDTHAGLIRKATQNQFYLFDNYEVEPTNNVIDVAGQNFRVGNLRLGIINANSYVTSAGLNVTDQANAAYGQANAAYGQANTARSDANTTFATVNTTFATINTTTATMNTATSNRVLKAGDTMTGNLIVSGATVNTATANITTIVTGNNLTLSTGTASNGNIVFSANGAEDMRITSEGAVLIGTTLVPMSHNLRVTKTRNDISGILLENPNTSTQAYSAVSYTTTGAITAFTGLAGSGKSTDGAIVANRALLYTDGGAGAGIIADSGPIVFAAGSRTESARITTGGDFGLGTTPAFTSGSGIEIQRATATATLRLDSSSFATELYGYTGGTGLFQLSAGYLDLGTNNTTRLRIDANGNVSIGTTSAVALVQIQNGNSTYTSPENSNVPVVYVRNTNNASTSAHAIVNMRTQPSGGNPFVSYDIEGVIGWSHGIDNADSDKFKINRGWSSLTTDTKLTIDASGNVGIGTANPTCALDVTTSGRIKSGGLYGTSGNGNIPIWQYDSSNLGYGIMYFEAASDYLKIDVSGSLVSGTPDFQVSPDAAYVNGNLVWHQGNDGSGSGLDADLWDGYQFTDYLNQAVKTTSSPTFSNMTVTGYITNIRNNGSVSAPSTSDHSLGTRITLYDANATAWYAIGIESDTMWFNADTQYKWYIDAVQRMILDSSGNLTASGNITAQSDERKKKNIKTIENPLNKVLGLRGVSFTKIDDDSNNIGVIAQEVEKILPEVVMDGQDGFKSVAYGNMVGLLIEAIKEQQKQIEELKAKLSV